MRLTYFFLPVAMAFGLIVGIAVYSGEAMPLRWVHHLQTNDSQAIYKTIDRDSMFAYKLMGTQLKQPEVIVIGSSRVLNFRGDFLNNQPSAFYNVGFSGMRMREIEAFVDELDANSAPNIMIMGVDQFWFNSWWADQREPVQITVGEINVGRVLVTTRRTWQEILMGNLNIDQLLRARDPIYGGRAMGLDAIMEGVGYLPDGSRQTDVVLLSDAQQGALRQKNLRDYWNGVGNYRGGNTVSEEALTQLERILQKAKALGINVVGFAPPFLPDIYNGMISSGNYRYLPLSQERISALFSAYSFPYFDFGDISSFNVSHKEMSDGIHPSEMLSLRIYMRMVEALPDWLGKYSDLPALQALIDAAPSTHEVFRVYRDG